MEDTNYKHSTIRTYNVNEKEISKMTAPYECVNVDVDKGSHQKLAVESVHQTAVSGNNVSKVLQEEGIHPHVRL